MGRDLFSTATSEQQEALDALHNIFTGLMKSGFSEDQALKIVINLMTNSMSSGEAESPAT
jgi:uncharacterized protein YoaH (UPF0181 family)